MRVRWRPRPSRCPRARPSRPRRLTKPTDGADAGGMQIERDERAETLDAPFREWLARVPGTVYVQQGPGTATTVYISPRVEELVGQPASSFTGLDDLWAALVHPDDQPRLRAADLLADVEGIFRCEYRLCVADGTYRWMRDEAHRQREDDVWIGMLFDIDEQKRTEEELRAAVRRFQTLAEQIPAVSYIESYDDEITPLYVSPRYEALFGYTSVERLADPALWERLVHPEDRERILGEIAALERDADGWSFEYRMRHRDGHVVWVRDEAVLVRDNDGRPLFYQGLLSDVTDSLHAKQELEAALDELRRADEMKNTFLTAVSHDLRTPLATILGNAITLEHADELALSDDERTQMLRSLAAKPGRAARAHPGAARHGPLDARRVRAAPRSRGARGARRARDPGGGYARRASHRARPAAGRRDGRSLDGRARGREPSRQRGQAHPCRGGDPRAAAAGRRRCRDRRRGRRDRCTARTARHVVPAVRTRAEREPPRARCRPRSVARRPVRGSARRPSMGRGRRGRRRGVPRAARSDRARQLSNRSPGIERGHREG